MLRNASAIKGYAIASNDGEIGAVSDFLFDDRSWLVRWLVVDTGEFLSSRKVLLPPSAVTQFNPEDRQLTVKLTMQQIKDSPDIDTDLPVSRQLESSIYDYYGWNPYWGRGVYSGGYGFVSGPSQELPSPGSWRQAEDANDAQIDEGDSHLRSIGAVSGYHIEANDGDIGHVADFLVRDDVWHVDYLVVDTNNWWPGKKVLISPKSVKEIDWPEKSVEIGADRQTVKDSPPYDASMTIDPSYEKKFHSHYG